jgi:hypothetical protein
VKKTDPEVPMKELLAMPPKAGVNLLLEVNVCVWVSLSLSPMCMHV